MMNVRGSGVSYRSTGSSMYPDGANTASANLRSKPNLRVSESSGLPSAKVRPSRRVNV